MDSLSQIADVVIGVDTHVATHSAAAVDTRTGGVLAEVTVEAAPDGYQELVEFADQQPGLRAWAIEGTGSHGAGLARHLARGGELVVELDRPERARRRNGAKSDPLDAIRAAREALSRDKLGTPRTTGERQALSVLLAARRSAVEAAKIAQQQIFGLVIAAPEQLRCKLRGKTTVAMTRTAAGLRLQAGWDLETRATAGVLRDLARRAVELSAEANRHEKEILAIVRAWHPELLERRGVGPIVAASVLCAWSHPGRVRSEAAFAMLGGAAPIPANSGQVTTHYRLNRYGDRQLNRAFHTVVLSRMRWDADTQAYIRRRTAQGKTPREIKRCLKRYVARELFRLLEYGPPAA
ncbi:MAG TPA: IS110 family transposase [Streptosporangiaceae bacterium]|nr:IS110 family transposase [Streptosporangiaceae bacterium]